MTEPSKPRKAFWRELPPAEMAAHLLATPTIADGVWTSEPRLPRETRSDFVRRVLLGETPESEPETPEAEAAEPAGLKRGYYLLNTDGGMALGTGGAASGTHWATRRSVRSCETPVWSPWLRRSRGRSGLPPTTRPSTRR